MDVTNEGAAVALKTEWVEIQPEVNIEAEFYEIANDFGHPLEILREAISNSVDAGATEVRIELGVREIDGASTSVIVIEDNGQGMAWDILAKDFWGLGFSRSRDNSEKIGEKGHGTKIYLRSDKVVVRSQTADEACEGVCENPMHSLSVGKRHVPRVRTVDKFQDHPGTTVEVYEYLGGERSGFLQKLAKDYILWFTKVGSVELQFGNERLKEFKLHLKCLDSKDFETLQFGHVFAEDASNIDRLFEKYHANAADLYVKRYIKEGRLASRPEIEYQAVVYVEGDQAKRAYNPMIREKRSAATGTYKVADRYGIWLAHDFIPVQRVNEWITGFGSGSNAFVLLHGFVNCQALKLTANRGSVANTDPQVISELKAVVQQLLAEIDKDLQKSGIYTLIKWQDEERTLSQERDEFERRVKSVEGRKIAKLDGRVLLEPENEAELFGLFMAVYALKPNLFDFEPLDYNTNLGIDLIARNNTDNKVSECTFWYVELKFLLKTDFNHAFKHIRWLLCWDFDKTAKHDAEFRSIEEDDLRKLQIVRAEGQPTVYFLENPAAPIKIQVIRLRELLKERLGLEFIEQT